MVQLSKSELKTISKLPPAMQESARAEILARKTADQAAYLAQPEVQARMARNQANREHFRTAVSTKNPDVLSVYGLGRRFGVALHKSEWIKLFANIDAIKAEVAKLPEA